MEDFARHTLDELVALQEAIYQANQAKIEVQAAQTQISITPPHQAEIVIKVAPATTSQKSTRFQ